MTILDKNPISTFFDLMRFLRDPESKNHIKITVEKNLGAKDKLQLIELFKAFDKEHNQIKPKDLVREDTNWTEKAIKQCVLISVTEGYAVVIAKNRNKVVGYLVFNSRNFEAGKSIAVINEIYVVPKFRSQGVAKDLIDAFEVYCRNTHGINLFKVNVLCRNTVAFSVYNKSGYEIVSHSMYKTN